MQIAHAALAIAHHDASHQYSRGGYQCRRRRGKPFLRVVDGKSGKSSWTPERALLSMAATAGCARCTDAASMPCHATLRCGPFWRAGPWVGLGALCACGERLRPATVTAPPGPKYLNAVSATFLPPESTWDRGLWPAQSESGKTDMPSPGDFSASFNAGYCPSSSPLPHYQAS